MAEEFDIGPLTWVKDEIDQALKSVLENLETFASNPADTSVLKFSRTHLFQVSGALDMVGLQGCKRYCAELETVIGKLEKHQIEVDAAGQEVLKQSVQILDGYLQGLLAGNSDRPLTLFPALESLAALHAETVAEPELFFPDTSIRAPKSVESDDVAEDQIPAIVAKQRLTFQTALLQWLKTASAESLEKMRTALLQVQRTQKQPAQKTFWWLTTVFAEALAQTAIAERNAVKLLCRQIDQQLRNLSQGNSKATGNLMRDLLYYIAQSESVSDGIRLAKSQFELEDLLPAEAQKAISSAELTEQDLGVFATLQDMVSGLKNHWSALAEGAQDALHTFIVQLESVVEQSRQLSDQSAHKLFEAIHGLVSKTVDMPEESVLVEVASSLNLMQDVFAQNQAFDGKVSQQIEMQTKRLQDVFSGEATASAMSAHLDETTMIAMAQQIKSALQTVENALDTFFRNPEQREVLKTVAKPLEQVVAAFDMLDMATPTKIASASAKLVDHFDLQPTTQHQTVTREFELVAESLSMLGFFVDEFPRVRAESMEALDKTLLALEAELAAIEAGVARDWAEQDEAEHIAIEISVSESPADMAENVADESIVDSQAEAHATDLAPVDPELKEIFIAEAEEVLANVAQHMQTLRVNNTDHEALVEVRRGYHTLKGSGRTVGLKALGEVAWTVEKLLNHIIEHDVLPGPQQLAYIEKASAAFSSWVDELNAQGACEPEYLSWQAEAAALENESAVQKPAAEAAEVLIGGTRKISRGLFDIFLGEARQHLETLKSESEKLGSGSAEFSVQNVIRSAHTLASNAGATGFKAVSDLSRALENWLDEHIGEWDAKSQTLLANVVKSLTTMMEKVEALTEPKRATALLTALKKATEKASAVRETLTSEQNEPALEAQADELHETAISDMDVATDISTDVETGYIAAETEAHQVEESSTSDDSDPVIDSIEVSSPLDQELLTIFTEEARELVPQIGNELRAWRKTPSDKDRPDALQRALHTLKGSARMAGQTEMGDVVHSMEDRIVQALKRKVMPVDFDDMFQDLDRIGGHLEALTGDAKSGRAAAAATPGRQSNRRAQYLRLRADVLDRLINEAGEVSIARSRMEREMLAFKHFSLDLTESVLRLRNYLRELEIETESQMQSRMNLLQETREDFDPLEFDRFTRLQELTRMMAESVNDVSTIQNGLLLNLDETEAALQQQGRMNRELQYGLMDVRMVPFSLISERLHRIVRQTAHELNKSVEMSIDGESVDIDRSVLDKIGAPLEHLLRNSVGHGIESSDERARKGKPEIGRIQLKVKRENDEIIITVSDDGGGISLERVRAKAISNGLLQEDQEMSEQNLLAVIFEPGFSTAADVTQISGRGVGLDAVRGDITGLGGRIEVVNSPEQGAVFTIYLPVTLTVAQVVLIRAAHHVYAIPSIMVEQLQKLKTQLLADAYGAKHIVWAEREYPIHYLGRLIGETELEPEPQGYTPVLLLRSGNNRIALHVDEIIGNQEIVMKPIGSQLARVPGITGATVMGDGKIVLIVNPVQMANRELIVVSQTRMVAAEAVPVSKPTVMVVDDSLTMRKVLSRTLEREGYQVLTAKDGMDALQLLQENKPDIILLDIEMPRMDGFEFARNVRGDVNTAAIPIIMISSRTAEKHQNHAKELGVNAFLGKPVQDDDLIAEINIQLGVSAVSA